MSSELSVESSAFAKCGLGGAPGAHQPTLVQELRHTLAHELPQLADVTIEVKE